MRPNLNPKNWHLPKLGGKKKAKETETTQATAGGSRTESGKAPAQTAQSSGARPAANFSRPFDARNPAPANNRPAVSHQAAAPTPDGIGRYTSGGHPIPDALRPGTKAQAERMPTDGLFLETPTPPAPTRQELNQVALSENLPMPRRLRDPETTHTQAKPFQLTSGPSPLSMVSTSENPVPHAAEKSHEGSGMTYAELKPLRDRLNALRDTTPPAASRPGPQSFDEMDLPGRPRSSSAPVRPDADAAARAQGGRTSAPSRREIPPAHKITDDFGLS